MVKNSALTLPVLVILVLVGAGVVLLGPQLTGQVALTRIQQVYPVGVSDSDLVQNPSYAVSDNNPNFATFAAAWGNVYNGGSSGSHRCPPGFTYEDIRRVPRLGEFPSISSCKFLDSRFYGWLATTNEFRSPGASLSYSIPDRVTSVEVNASIQYFGPSIDYDPSSSLNYIGGITESL